MTDNPELIQYTLYLTRDQIVGLDDVKQRTGIGRQSSIRRAIHDFLMSESSTYRSRQQSEQQAEAA